MHINDYYHNDVRRQNICFISTKITHIKILKYQIPTFGYIFSLIDYGNIYSYKFNMDNSYHQRCFLRNLKYEDNLALLSCVILFEGSAEFHINNIDKVILDRDILYKIIHKIKYPESNFFNDKRINLDDTIYFIKNINNERKLIKFFFNKLC